MSHQEPTIPDPKAGGFQAHAEVQKHRQCCVHAAAAMLFSRADRCLHPAFWRLIQFVLALTTAEDIGEQLDQFKDANLDSALAVPVAVTAFQILGLTVKDVFHEDAKRRYNRSGDVPQGLLGYLVLSRDHYKTARAVPMAPAPTTHFMWVDSTSEETLVEDYAAVTGKLKLSSTKCVLEISRPAPGHHQALQRKIKELNQYAVDRLALMALGFASTDLVGMSQAALKKVPFDLNKLFPATVNRVNLSMYQTPDDERGMFNVPIWYITL